jgi:D-arabinose 1-dehydrogenase-like Zn-dependent alcohol dehydrogenase
MGYKTTLVPSPGGPLQLVDREIPSPKPDWVRIRVEACGFCHSDSLMKEGYRPGLQYPRVPGHQVAGVIDELARMSPPGKKASAWAWDGMPDMMESAMRAAAENLVLCHNGGITGFTHDAGYSEYMVAPAQSLAAIPDSLPAEDAAPLMCAGITTFNALRHSGAHSKDLALKLGAHAYINSDTTKPAEELQRMGGAKAILSTAPSGKAMSALIDGLGDLRKLVVIGASAEPIEVTPIQLIGGMKSIQGWAAGVAADSEDALGFSALTGVRPMIEKFPLQQAAQAYQRMMSGKARFRVVLTM